MIASILLVLKVGVELSSNSCICWKKFQIFPYFLPSEVRDISNIIATCGGIHKDVMNF